MSLCGTKYLLIYTHLAQSENREEGGLLARLWHHLEKEKNCKPRVEIENRNKIWLKKKSRSMGTLPRTLAALSSVGGCAKRTARLLHNQTLAQCTLLTWGHTTPEVQSQGRGWVGSCDKSDFSK